MRKAVVCMHVGHAQLGALGPVLNDCGFQIRIVEATQSGALRAVDPLEADLLVVLDGPVSAMAGREHPFLFDEMALMRRRLDARRPTIGIGLGAKLLASVVEPCSWTSASQAGRLRLSDVGSLSVVS